MRLGVDVGGTNTDAVLMNGTAVIATTKVATTENIGDGIVTAISDLINSAQPNPDAITQVMIGTTQFTNAFVQRNDLQKVAVVRLALPATASIPPFTGWPEHLADIVCGGSFLVKGGYEYDGREISALNEKEIREVAKQIGDLGIEAVALSCAFSTGSTDMEVQATQILESELKGVNVTRSGDIGSTGLLARENAAIVNCSLNRLSDKVIQSFVDALASLGLTAPLYISQNDGTLMSVMHARRFPVLTFASGPTNSMRGAALLSGAKDAIIVDIGGTTSDVGVLQNGFPRQSAGAVDIGGVHTNFRMPDVLSVGIGGGSVIEDEAIGPESVGYELTREAMVFGGNTLTPTDIAVAMGTLTIGDASRVSHLAKEFIEHCNDRIHERVSDAIDRMKTSATAQPVILVGGGNCLINRTLPGASKQMSPEHADVANAIGAAIAQVSGEIDKVFAYDTLGREIALELARTEATEKAIAAGADRTTIEIMDIEEVPLAYMPGGSVRIRAKAVGNLDEGKH